MNNVTKLIPYLPMQCDNEECSCKETWETRGEHHLTVYCDTYRSGAHAKLNEDPVRWNIIVPIPRETFDMAITKAMPELKEYKEWKEELSKKENLLWEDPDD